MSTTYTANLILGVHENELPLPVVEDIRDGCYDNYVVCGIDERICGIVVASSEDISEISYTLSKDYTTESETFDHLFQVFPKLYLVVDKY